MIQWLLPTVAGLPLWRLEKKDRRFPILVPEERLSVDSEMQLLIAGGQRDPNLLRLVQACVRLNFDYFPLLHSPGASPGFSWCSADNKTEIEGVICMPQAAFIRYDVFEGLADPRPVVGQRAIAWHQAIQGWLLGSPDVRMLNRHQLASSSNKLSMLRAAQRVGLKIPETEATNLELRLRELAKLAYVTKPVAGGDYCYELSQTLVHTEFRNGNASCPAFVQPRLIQPEIRIYVIGDSSMAFEMRSPSLDYRVNQDANVVLLDSVPSVVDQLRQLMHMVGLDFGAADFKTDSSTGELLFLELNTSPMFAQFDIESGGKLCELMINHLCRST